MDASAITPPKGTNDRHQIPPELVSEILLNLPLKSLLRFSSVSKSWNSIMFESSFIRRHRALPGRERVALVAGNGGGKATTFLIPPTSSHNPTIEAAELVCPFGDGEYHIKASCGELWLARARESLYLWSPSTRRYKEVRMPPTGVESRYFVGLGYESVGDDYRILKIPYGFRGGMFELYSMRNDSWRSIQGFPKDILHNRGPCEVVSGKLHWLSQPDCLDFSNPLPYEDETIVSFDLSMEEFGEVALPANFIDCKLLRGEGMSVLKGKLCLSNCRSVAFAWDIWVMEEYGVARSWTLKFSIMNSYTTSFSNNYIGFEVYFSRPLYLYENGDVLVWVFDAKRGRRLFVFDKTGRREVDFMRSNADGDDVFLYVDSLVAP